MLPKDFIKMYENALATQNWEKVSPLIAKNAVVTFSSGIVNKGKASIKKAFEHNFSVIKSEKYEVTNVDWIFENSTKAVYTFDFHWKGIINGNEVSGAGRGTSVLINENDTWLLLSEHLGPMPKL